MTPVRRGSGGRPAVRRGAGEEGVIAPGIETSARLLIATLERERPVLEAMARLWASTVERGRTIFFCGNGGSAAEAQHFAAELVGRFVRERAALPSLALTTDTSILTSVANDYGFERVFARQIEALGRRGDLLVILTTSGRSANVAGAVAAARAKGMRVAGMTGAGGRAFAKRCDLCLVVPSRETPRIQEVHLVVGHLCCERAEKAAPRRRTGAALARRRPGGRG